MELALIDWNMWCTGPGATQNNGIRNDIVIAQAERANSFLLGTKEPSVGSEGKHVKDCDGRSRQLS